MPELYWLLNGQHVDAQYLDYKQSDFNQNGFIRLDLKYPLNGGQNNNDNNGHQHQRNLHSHPHQHQRRQHGQQRMNNNNNNNVNWNNKRQLSSSNLNYDSNVVVSIDKQQQQSTIDSYHFECIQILSNVISVSSEVVQLYGTSSSSSSSSGSNHELEQSLNHGNSVEAGMCIRVNSFFLPNSFFLLILSEKFYWKWCNDNNIIAIIIIVIYTAIIFIGFYDNNFHSLYPQHSLIFHAKKEYSVSSSLLLLFL